MSVKHHALTSPGLNLDFTFSDASHSSLLLSITAGPQNKWVKAVHAQSVGVEMDAVMNVETWMLVSQGLGKLENHKFGIPIMDENWCGKTMVDHLTVRPEKPEFVYVYASDAREFLGFKQAIFISASFYISVYKLLCIRISSITL